jgi:ABC-type multidrug transport system fused ATPase/permease subunit
VRKTRDALRTLGLLFEIDRGAFLIGALTSVLQAIVYPLVLLVLWQGVSLLMEGAQAGTDGMRRGPLLLAGLLGLLVAQAVLQTANETATSMLRAESAQEVNGRIMHKMCEVPYHLFEDNAFQSQYGLLISQASYRPGLLVEALVGAISALVACLAFALTLAALAPLLLVFLLVLIPLTIVETRYHSRIVDLQTTAAPELFRMMHLTQKSIDAAWQRDIRVHRSTILSDEYRVLAGQYLHSLKRLLHGYQIIRIGVGLASAVTMTLAMGVVFWQVSATPGGLAQVAILVPALVMGLSQGRAFAFSWGSLVECIRYLTQVYDFLNRSFDVPPRSTPAARSHATRPVVAYGG